MASGGEADIFEYGQTSVLRRSRNGKSLAREAKILDYLRVNGYPVPAVGDLSSDETELVMERVGGRPMAENLGRAPWTVRRHAQVLADLHRQLHEIAAPEFLSAAPVGQGNSVVHLDLHPGNVIMSRNGPVVVDWMHAARGDENTDLAFMWVIVCSGDFGDNWLVAKLQARARSLLVEACLKNFDREQVRRQVQGVISWKSGHSQLGSRETQAMWSLFNEVR